MERSHCGQSPSCANLHPLATLRVPQGGTSETITTVGVLVTPQRQPEQETYRHACPFRNSRESWRDKALEPLSARGRTANCVSSRGVSGCFGGRCPPQAQRALAIFIHRDSMLLRECHRDFRQFTGPQSDCLPQSLEAFCVNRNGVFTWRYGTPRA